MSDEVIQEKVQDQKVLAEIAQRGNQAFVEQYFTRIGSTVPPKAQKSLDEGLTPHFEQGQEGDKVLVFSEPQHISLEADGGKLNLVVQLGERPQIKPAPRDKASSEVVTSLGAAKPGKPKPVSKSDGSKQGVSWTKPLSKGQWEKLIGAVVGKMRQEFNRQGYHISDSALQEIAVEHLAHCHSMQDLVRLGEKLKERNAQFSDELPHYVQVAYSPGHMQANALIAVQEFVKALLYLLPPFIASNYSKNQSGAKNNSSERYIEPEQDDLSELEGHKDSSMGNTRYLTVEERQDREDLASRLEVYRKELNKQGHSFERDLGPEQGSSLDGRRGSSEKDNSSRRYLELDAQEDLMRRFGHPIPKMDPSRQGNSSGRGIRLENREGLRLGSNSLIHGTDFRENTLIFPSEPHKPTILITPPVQEGFNDSVETFPAEIHLPTTLITPPHESNWKDSVYEGAPTTPAMPLCMFKKFKEASPRPHAPNPDHRYHETPKNLPGFPEATRVKPKNGRPIWKLPSGKTLELDKQHGDLEMYNTQKDHLGSFDINTGEQTKERVRGRKLRD